MALNTIFNQGGGLSSGLSNEQTLINNLYNNKLGIAPIKLINSFFL